MTDRQITHAPGCWGWGPRHYECALREIERLAAQLAAAQRPAEDGCHCGTCTCNPNMTPAVRFDLSPAQMEGAIRDHLIRLGWTPPDERAMSQQPEERGGGESEPPSAPVGVDEAAAIRAFEEHFEASAEDPYFEGELELWLTAWRKALAAQQQEPTT